MRQGTVAASKSVTSEAAILTKNCCKCLTRKLLSVQRKRRRQPKSQGLITDSDDDKMATSPGRFREQVWVLWVQGFAGKLNRV
jgi:hypothetical protein